MTIHLLTGFLGSGKTTSIQQACRALQKKGLRAGVITNDQGIRLVDGYLFNSLGIPEKQVGNGCFCCNYADLDKNISALVDEHRPDIIFAESVGSCTDIIATVMKPLLRYRQLNNVTLSVIVDTRLLHMLLKKHGRIFHEDVEYIYFKQIEEAEIIVLNKNDLADPLMLNEVMVFLHQHYPGKKLVLQNSLFESGISGWLDELSFHAGNASLLSLEINYDKYASGESLMGYLDQEFIVRSDNGRAEEAALFCINTFVDLVKASGNIIGHMKFWLNDKYKLSFTSTTSYGPGNDINIEHTSACSLIVNARVQAAPEELNSLMLEAIEKTQLHTGITISDNTASFFKPGYPRPLHRIEN